MLNHAVVAMCRCSNGSGFAELTNIDVINW